MPDVPSNPTGLLVLGGGPTREEVKAGRALVGPTGSEMEDILRQAGVERDRLAVVHAWACVPHEPRKETEERKAVECCRPLTSQAVTGLPVTLPTLACGKWAQLLLTGREKGLTQRRGFRYDTWRIGDPLKQDEE